MNAFFLLRKIAESIQCILNKKSYLGQLFKLKVYLLCFNDRLWLKSHFLNNQMGLKALKQPDQNILAKNGISYFLFL